MESFEDIPDKHLQLFAEFKRRVSDVIKSDHDDYYLMKWLKARSFVVKDAEKMFRESLAYREKMQVDQLIDSYVPPKVLEEYFPGGMCGHDRDGSPLCVELFGAYDMKGLMSSTKRSELEKLKLYQCQLSIKECQSQTEKLGKRVDGITVIFDMENVGTKFLWKPGLEMYLHLIKVLEDNYPEMTKRLLVIHAPSIFPLLWRLCRPLVSDDMRKKIFVLGSDYKTELLTFADVDQLPGYLGGKIVDPDGNNRCPSKIRPGGTVPKSYYLSETLDFDEMNETLIESNDVFRLEFRVTMPGSVLRWEFRTDSYDISFGVSFIDENTKEKKELIPIKKCNSHLVTEDDSIICKSTGTYILIFDNTSSWMRSKRLLHRVDLHSVDEKTKTELETLYEITSF